jgi:glutathione S-transferase
MIKPTLVYFAARGRAELIRFVLAEAGVDYQEHSINGPATLDRPTEFAALKASGTLPFEQVPTWEEPGGFRLAQSLAILGYLARTHGLHGKSAHETAQIEQTVLGMEDLRGELRKLVTAAPEKRAELRQELIATTLPRWLGFLEKLLAANHGGRGWFVGDSVSTADLAACYLVELIRDNGMGAPLEKAPLVAALAARVAERPRIAAYLKSPRRWPLALLPT